MKIHPINNNNSSTNFKSKIRINSFLQEGLNAARKNVERSEYKCLNEAKNVYDSLRKIGTDKKIKEVIFDIDREAKEAYALADGVKTVTYQYPQNCCTGYISTQIIKKYAESLNFAPMPTILDSYKQEYEILCNNLQRANKLYQKQMETDLEELVTRISA